MPVPPLPVPVPPLPLPVPVPPLPLPLLAEPPLAPDPLDEFPPVPIPVGEMPPVPEVWLPEVVAFKHEVGEARTESAKSNRLTLSRRTHLPLTFLLPPPASGVHSGRPGNLRRMFAPD